MKEKLKSFLSDDAIYITFVVLGVGIIAFMLGRLSVVTAPQQITGEVNKIVLCPTTVCPAPLPVLASPEPTPTTQAVAASTPVTPATGASYVASKAGTKYHHVTCPGAKQIKEENKIYFSSVAQAQAAGYSKAANCNR